MIKKIKIGYQMHLLSIPYLLWMNSIQNEFILWVYKQKRQPRRGSGPLSRRCTASLLLDASSRPTDCPRCCSEKRCAAFFKCPIPQKARATTPGNEVSPRLCSEILSRGFFRSRRLKMESIKTGYEANDSLDSSNNNIGSCRHGILYFRVASIAEILIRN